jgi:hypothetical protein
MLILMVKITLPIGSTDASSIAIRLYVIRTSTYVCQTPLFHPSRHLPPENTRNTSICRLLPHDTFHQRSRISASHPSSQIGLIFWRYVPSLSRTWAFSIDTHVAACRFLTLGGPVVVLQVCGKHRSSGRHRRCMVHHSGKHAADGHGETAKCSLQIRSRDCADF